jgi:fatty-acyl-CoA synthase
MANFSEFLGVILKSFGKHPVIIRGDEVITYKEFDERTNQLARAMLRLGVKRDENVGLAEFNTPEFMEVTAAAWKIAARSIPLNFRFKEWELKYIIDDAEMSAIFFNEELIERVKNIRPELKSVRQYVIIGGQKEKGMVNYRDILENELKTPPQLPWRQLEGEDVVVIMYTGGTTGYPKGVVYRHDQVLSAALEAMITTMAEGFEELSRAPRSVFLGLRRMLGLPGLDRFLPWLLAKPATRKAAISVGKNAGDFILRSPRPALRLTLGALSLLTGGKVVMLHASPLMHAWAYNHAIIGMIGGFTNVFLTSKSFDVQETLETIGRRKVNILISVGDGQCRPLVEELDRAKAEGRQFDLSTLMVVLSSGMALSVDVKRRLLEHVPHLIILDTYASSEGHYIAMKPYTSGERDIQKTVFKVTQTTKVLDEEGNEVRPGEIGEIAIFRDHIGSSEYFKDREKSAKTYRIVGGRPVIFTGDMATVDEQGRIHLLGRGSGCINTGGEKVFPEEVEEVINKHPLVEIAGVTSVPHERWGEAVTAVVQLREGAKLTGEEIISWCKDCLADYKAPKYVLFVEEMPRLITGKVHYREIKKLVMEKIKA